MNSVHSIVGQPKLRFTDGTEVSLRYAVTALGESDVLSLARVLNLNVTTEISHVRPVVD